MITGNSSVRRRDNPEALGSNTTKLVIVEGLDEDKVLGQRLGAHVQVYPAHSKDKIAKFLLDLRIQSGFATQIKKVVVMLDNDDDPQSTHADALRWLEAAGLAGIGAVLTVPAHGQPGMLEDLLLSDIAETDLACIRQFFDCARASNQDFRSPNGKAQFQAWLAINSPGDNLGWAINKRKVELNGPAMTGLIARLKSELGD